MSCEEMGVFPAALDKCDNTVFTNVLGMMSGREIANVVCRLAVRPDRLESILLDWSCIKRLMVDTSIDVFSYITTHETIDKSYATRHAFDVMTQDPDVEIRQEHMDAFFCCGQTMNLLGEDRLQILFEILENSNMNQKISECIKTIIYHTGSNPPSKVLKLKIVQKSLEDHDPLLFMKIMPYDLVKRKLNKLFDSSQSQFPSYMKQEGEMYRLEMVDVLVTKFYPLVHSSNSVCKFVAANADVKLATKVFHKETILMKKHLAMADRALDLTNGDVEKVCFMKNHVLGKSSRVLALVQKRSGQTKGFGEFDDDENPHNKAFKRARDLVGDSDHKNTLDSLLADGVVKKKPKTGDNKDDTGA